MSAAPAAKAHALVERRFALLHECRATVRNLEPGHDRQESPVTATQRLLYFGLVAAIEDGVVRTTEDALKVLRQANQPLGPMGKE